MVEYILRRRHFKTFNSRPSLGGRRRLEGFGGGLRSSSQVLTFEHLTGGFPKFRLRTCSPALPASTPAFRIPFEMVAKSMRKFRSLTDNWINLSSSLGSTTERRRGGGGECEKIFSFLIWGFAE